MHNTHARGTAVIPISQSENDTQPTQAHTHNGGVLRNARSPALRSRVGEKHMHDVHTRENCVYANVHYIYIYIRVMSTQSKNWREEGTYACLRVGVGHEGCENLLCTYRCARQKELEQTCLAAFEILVVALVAAARRHLPHLVELPLSGRRVETQADPLWIKSYLLFFQIQCVCVDASPDDRCSLQTIENTFVKSKSY